VVLSSFQEVEIISRPCESSPRVGGAALAVSAAPHELELALQRYQGGAVGYLEVVTAEHGLDHERPAIEIARAGSTRACCGKALGGPVG